MHAILFEGEIFDIGGHAEGNIGDMLEEISKMCRIFTNIRLSRDSTLRIIVQIPRSLSTKVFFDELEIRENARLIARTEIFFLNAVKI